jgi:hypothetical protein
MGELLLKNCSRLKQIECHNPIPPQVFPNTFESVNRSIPIYVPKDKIEDYKKAEGWKEFLNFLPIIWVVDSIYYEFDDETMSATVIPGHIPYSGSINIPPTVIHKGKEYVVNTIAARAFYNSRFLTSVTIPNSIDSIGTSAFSGCVNLKELTLPDSLGKIADSLCQGCPKLEEITIPHSVTEIGVRAFQNCSKLKMVEISNGVRRINRCAFQKCISLIELDIPYGVELLEDSSFIECDSLKKLTIAESVTHIKDYVFAMCPSLDTLSIPNNVNSIGNSAFELCTGLKSISLPETLDSIGNKSFNKCYALCGISIPDSVRFIGQYAFSSCFGLREITIPEGIAKIEKGTFYLCDSLRSISFPSTLREIGDSAFFDCHALESLTLNDSLEKIGKEAFKYCVELKKITNLNATIPDLAINVFSYTDKTIPVYVLMNNFDDYKKNNRWSSFENIIGCYRLELTCEDSMGRVNGSGYHPAGSQVVISAIANPDYVFDMWEDECTDSVRTISLTADLTLKAQFKSSSTTVNTHYCQPNEVRIYVMDNRIVVEETDEYAIYSLNGIKINNADRLLPGIYIVIVGNKSHKVIIR